MEHLTAAPSKISSPGSLKRIVTELNLTNYRWPAEWEPHTATWVGWPVSPETWPGIFELIPPAYAKFIAAMARFEQVNVLATDETQKLAKPLVYSACEEAGAAFEVKFFDIPINDSWCRDYGPIFLNRRSDVAAGPEQVIIDWDYNSWGGKYPPWDHDAAVAKQISDRIQIQAVKPGIILEGGAIEGNGNGVLLTTESCLLNPNRNPNLNKEQMEEALRKFLQVESFAWLPGEGIVGDDTDGHIDQVARFVSDTKVLVAAAYDDDAPEAADLRANLKAVADFRSASGSLQPVELRMPKPKFQQEHRLPACYCNFYIVNNGVIVPTFEDAADDVALQLLQDAFPDRTIVGVNAIELIWGLGAFHCMTQQQPVV